MYTHIYIHIILFLTVLCAYCGILTCILHVVSGPLSPFHVGGWAESPFRLLYANCLCYFI